MMLKSALFEVLNYTRFNFFFFFALIYSGIVLLQTTWIVLLWDLQDQAIIVINKPPGMPAQVGNLDSKLWILNDDYA